MVQAGLGAFCSRHAYDLVVVDKPLDDSARARGRSPAWQKCLVHKSEAAAGYQQLAWVDADIRIRPDSPGIFDEVPVDRVGAVDVYATPTPSDYSMALQRTYREWDAAGVNYVSNSTPQEYYSNYGLNAPFENVVQTGVIVFSPLHHKEILEKTYGDYEEKGDASWNYEMRPLSYELVKSGAVKWLSPKFNMPWSCYERLYYPFLAVPRGGRLSKLLERIKMMPRDALRRQCVASAFVNNYFLHFSGGRTEFRLLPSPSI